MNEFSSKEQAHASAPEAIASTSSPENDQAAESCVNCGAELAGTYCSVCGQRAANRIVPLWQVTNEFLEDLFDLDVRILRTFPTFFFHPGHLTVEYVRGRRRRYIRPLRLYLFSSFLLFTVLALTNVSGFSFSFGPSPAEAQAEVETARAELSAVRSELAQRMRENVPSERSQSAIDSESSVDSTGVPIRRTRVAGSIDKGMQRVDEALAALGPALSSQKASAPAPPAVAGTVEDLTERSVALEPKLVRILQEPGRLVDDLIDRAPYLMFLLVPTFALLLKLLYLRRGRLYLEHLVFALHVHALAFIAFALSTGLGALNVGTSLSLDWWMAAAPFGYLLAAMRYVYGQSLAVSALKTLVLLLAYGIILVVAVVLLVVATVALV